MSGGGEIAKAVFISPPGEFRTKRRTKRDQPTMPRTDHTTSRGTERGEREREHTG
jgi:hypothetical protein